MRAPVKLNLFLHINGKIPAGPFQGYHELQTYFQRVDYGDELQITPTDSPEILVEWQAGDESIARQPQDRRQDLIWRAADALQRLAIAAEQPVFGAHIRVIKNAPVGGGLGGGSSAAATMLRALNTLWGLNLSPALLLDIGRGLGADVPVFVAGINAWAEGIGDQLTALASPVAGQWFVILAPYIHRPTAAGFADPNLPKKTPRQTSQWLPNWRSSGFNAFEKSCLRDPIISHCHEALLQTTGFARLTGSGACLFSPMPNELDVQQAAVEISRKIKTAGRVITARALPDDPLTD